MAVGGILARDTTGFVTQTGPGSAGDVLTSNGAGAVPTFQTPGSGPVASAFPLVISSDFAVADNTGVVVPESFEIAAGVIVEIGDGARLEVTGPVGNRVIVSSLLSSAFASGSTAIPADDTIPQITEGDEYMTLTVTPTSATSTLEIKAVATLCNQSGSRSMFAALFRDSGADAINVGSQFSGAANAPIAVPINHTMTAGTTSAVRFSVRGGTNGGGTNNFNGFSGGRMFGTAVKSSLVITEYYA